MKTWGRNIVRDREEILASIDIRGNLDDIRELECYTRIRGPWRRIMEVLEEDCINYVSSGIGEGDDPFHEALCKAFDTLPIPCDEVNKCIIYLVANHKEINKFYRSSFRTFLSDFNIRKDEGWQTGYFLEQSIPDNLMKVTVICSSIHPRTEQL